MKKDVNYWSRIVTEKEKEYEAIKQDYNYEKHWNHKQSKQIEELKADRDKWLGKYYNADELLTLAKEEIKELRHGRNVD